MKIPYIDKVFRTRSHALIAVCNRIIEEYAAQGYDLTLRQLYYQMIAGDHFPDEWIDEEYNRKHGLEPRTKNTEKNYDKFGTLLSDARLAGLVDWDAIVDRGRALRGLAHWDNPGQIISSAANGFHYDLWEDQPTRMEVWVEKDALSDVVGRPSNRWDVPFFACKGYTSQSEMWAAAQRLINHMEHGQNVVVLHLGDHDPSGLDMSRDIEDRLRLFCEYHGVEAPEIKRIALNMNQVRKYNPPPNPAKLTDCRATKYIQEYGRNSWELDALGPKVMDDLISEHIEEIIDIEKFNAAKQRQENAREELKQVAKHYDSVVDHARGGCTQTRLEMADELETLHNALEASNGHILRTAGYDALVDLATPDISEKEKQPGWNGDRRIR